jgi:hypothetical protein
MRYRAVNDAVWGLDYRCADGRFLLPKCGVTILNGLSVSSSEKEFDNGIKS